MRVRALVPPLTLTQSGTILCPLHTKQASPTTQGGVLIHIWSPHRRQKCTQLPLVQNADHCADFDYPGLLPAPGDTSSSRTPPRHQNTQASIRKPRDFTQSKDPFYRAVSHLRLLPRRQPFLGCASPPDPNGAQSPEVPQHRRTSYKPCSSQAPNPQLSLTLPLPKQENHESRERTPLHKARCLTGDPVPARPGRSPALTQLSLLLLPA